MFPRRNSRPDPRIFLAVDIPNHVRLSLLSLTTVQIPAVHMVSDESYHVTLHFLGNTPIAPVARVARTIFAPPFDLTLNSVSAFPNQNLPLTIFAGVHSPGVMHLQQRLDIALGEAGFHTDSRRYVPHVALAKVPRDREDAVQAARIFLAENDDFSVQPFRVNEFVLMESVVSRTGQYHYIIRDRFPLVEDDDTFSLAR